jgi:hypothetical protein
MWILRNSLPVVLLLAATCQAQQPRALQECFRPDPFGGIVESDRQGAGWLKQVNLKAARGSYASFHLVISKKASADYKLSVRFPLAVDVYREWFHFNTPDKKYYPDALIPVSLPYQFQIPDPDNKIPGQTAQAFWIDLWIPADSQTKTYQGEAIVSTSSGSETLPIALSVIPAVVPKDDAVTLDNNSYGTSWLVNQYPKTLAAFRDSSEESPAGEDRLIGLIHAYHRIFYENRGTFHQLGYGHAGKVGPEFAPELTGTGRQMHIASWDLFDRHYGPLLDGSAFRDTRRGAKPIPFMYLPVNPEWPASFLWWGEPGYDAEFVNVLSEMERHFREKHWTHTKFEVFFNHKKRYKGFPWDGDEVRFERDNNYFRVYHRMLEQAIPRHSPVHFVMRADTSWTAAQQFRELEGVIGFWVVGEGELIWHPDAIPRLKQHGDIIWTYGGTPAVQKVGTEITLNPLRSWINGVDGFVRWQTVEPGSDPWFHLNGGDLTLVYPGERFNIAGPIPSIRLKLQRNCLQDLALLNALSTGDSRRTYAEEVVRRFNHTQITDWSNANAKLPAKPIIDWNNADFADALKPYEARFANLDPGAWLRVREYILDQAEKTQ